MDMQPLARLPSAKTNPKAVGKSARPPSTPAAPQQGELLMNPHYAHVDMPQHEPRRCRAVFPCTDAKKPAVRHWQGHFASAKRLDAARYIGISPPDDIIIFDVDTDEGITIDDIDVALGVSLPWEDAFLQSTPSGGAHYAFKAPVSVLEAIPNKSKAMGLVGFDLRLPRRGYVYTGKGYRPNGLFPSLRYALENGNWPRLPDCVAGKIAKKRQDAPTQCARIETTVHAPSTEGGARGGTIPTFTIPTEPGTRNAHLLFLARWFKGQNPNATHQDLFEACAAWHKRALPTIRTKDLATSFNELKAAYRLCTTPMTASFDALIDGYEAEYLPNRFAKRCNEAETIAAKIAAKLQRFHGENALFISCRKLAEVLGCSHVYAARILKSLVTKGILALSKVGRYGPKMARMASEYFCTITPRTMGRGGILPCVNQIGDSNDEKEKVLARDTGPTVETGANRASGTPAQGRTHQREPETLRTATLGVCFAV